MGGPAMVHQPISPMHPVTKDRHGVPVAEIKANLDLNFLAVNLLLEPGSFETGLLHKPIDTLRTSGHHRDRKVN